MLHFFPAMPAFTNAPNPLKMFAYIHTVYIKGINYLLWYLSLAGLGKRERGRKEKEGKSWQEYILEQSMKR